MDKVTSEKDFRTLLTNAEREYVVIHYKCTFCNDKQATDEEEISDILEIFNKYSYIPTGYHCTSCDCAMEIISIEDIFGLEFVE
jgi:hypothetical protein